LVSPDRATAGPHLQQELDDLGLLLGRREPVEAVLLAQLLHLRVWPPGDTAFRARATRWGARQG
jgi:hypothetical protein